MIQMMRKWSFGLLTALVLCLGLLAGTAGAVEGDALTDMLDFREELTSASGTGYAWDAETKTLTLNGLNLRIERERVLSSALGAVSLPADSTIILEGTSNITVGQTQNGSYGGISFTGNLTVTGTGTLNISVVSSGAGFYCNNLASSSLQLESGTINVTGNADYTVGIISGKVSICGAEVNIKNVRHGIGIFYSSGAELVEVSGGSLKIEGDGIAYNGEGISLHRRNSDTPKFKLSITGGSVDISKIVTAIDFYEGCVTMSGGSLNIHDLIKNRQGYNWAFTGYASGTKPQIDLTGGDISISGCREWITMNGDTQEGAIHIADSLELSGLLTTYRVISEENINQNEVAVYGDYTLPESVKFPKEQNGAWVIFMAPNSRLTIPDGVVFDLSEAIRDESKDSIDLSAGSVVVNGTMKLPGTITAEQLVQWKLSGSGTVMLGEEICYPVTVIGGTADRIFAKPGDTVTLTAINDLSKRFKGWTVSPSVSISEDNTFIMPSEAVTITGEYDTLFVVTFNGQGSPEIQQAVLPGQPVVKPADPTRTGYLFGGWFREETCETPWDFETDTVTANLTLYAKWTPEPQEPVTPEPEPKPEPKPEPGPSRPSGGTSSSRDDDEKETRPPASTTTTTTQNPDGTTTSVTTDRTTGNVTTVTKDPGGASVSVTQDKGGNVTSVRAEVPAQKDGGTVRLPAEAERGTEIDIRVRGGGTAAVEIPAKGVTPGTVAVLVSPNGAETVDRRSVSTENGMVVTVRGSAVVRLEDRGQTFPDVPEGWKAEAAAFASARKILNGGTDGRFRPDAAMTRAMLAVALHNLEGNPPFGSSSAFADVSEKDWYAEAVAWASAGGIVTGYTEELFGPNDKITREQLAVLLWRAAGRPAPSSRTLPFADADQAGDYARDALCWAVERGIINGTSGGVLEPKGIATRAQAARMLKNYLENI